MAKYNLSVHARLNIFWRGRFAFLLILYTVTFAYQFKTIEKTSKQLSDSSRAHRYATHYLSQNR